MKGSSGVVDALNDILTAELTGINQYFIHGRMCESWGYGRLWDKLREESIEEMKHADKLIERILYLEGLPNVQRLGKIKVGESVPEQLALDLALEKDAVGRMNQAIELCRTEGDHGSRRLLEEMLASEEVHVGWIEAQLSLIAQIGAPGYLARQIKS